MISLGMTKVNRCYDYYVFSLRGVVERIVGWERSLELIWTGDWELPVLVVGMVDVDSGRAGVDSNKGVPSGSF